MHMNNMIKYAPSHIKNDEQFGRKKFARERAARRAASLQEIKDGNAPPALFKVNDDNQQLWTFYSKTIYCPNARLVHQHKRIE